MGDKLKTMLQTNNLSSAYNNNHGCNQNKKQEYDSEQSQMKAPGLKTSESKLKIFLFLNQKGKKDTFLSYIMRLCDLIVSQ